MLSLRDIKRRIKSVGGIRQITRAMEMVAATKLRRSQQRIEAARPYTEKMDEILAHLKSSVDVSTVYNPLLIPHETIKIILILAVASDKGLCGSFNSNVIRHTEESIRNAKKEGRSVSLLLVGKKIHDYFRRRKYDILPESATFRSIDQALSLNLLSDITEICTKAFVSNSVDRVDMIYTEFKSVVSHKVITRQFLPITGLTPDNEIPEDTDKTEETDKSAKALDYIFEPEPGKLFSVLIPKYARVMIFRMLADSLASEHGARMTGMHSATDNAGDMIRTLTLHRNKARQAAITKELAEIVGGAEALKG
ncbi:MAG: ATP synthase F1 subunit gamma [bacterium]